ncbi:probable imidazolonepropionase [Littorina saxatilis]|uniref:Probable imidazolonepropionase n=1 Tax=Littorina saxatilis TaxID=31220 RepID=A0AAN9GCN4_9CAEN
MTGYKLLVKNARQVVQVSGSRESVKRGSDMNNLQVLEGAEGGYSILVDRDGIIADLGPSREVEARHCSDTIDTVVDATGRCLIPGLVDAHTHTVWAGDRVHEFAMKLAGATYMDVHKAGGGIYFTVEHTRGATEDTLYELLKERLVRAVRAGSTFVEVKSGYGLDLDTEVKMLKVTERARQSLPVDISCTYCGAHAIPKEKTSQEATTDVVNVQLPRIKDLMSSKQLCVHNIDVFCEQGVFDVTQSRDILLAGKSMGLNLNFHGEELHRLHSAEMGAEIGALAISHLEEVSEEGISAMAKSGTVGVLLPTTAYNLRLTPPPARAMIDGGMAVALGSDFNPNAHCLAMPLVMNLACVTLRMTMSESLVAATLNAAHALGQSDRHGSLEVGKLGNMLVLDAPRWEHLIYQMGSHQDVISHVIWHGDVVHRKQ